MQRASLKHYTALKDSLDAADQQAALQTGFADHPLPAAEISKIAHHFPYLYFWLLFVMMVGSAVFIFRFKK